MKIKCWFQENNDLTLNVLPPNVSDHDIVLLYRLMLQRSKINWLTKGDGNNAFFHAYIKARHNAKNMQFIQKEDGTILNA